MMKNLLCYKAGPGILPIIRDEGLKPERVRVFTGPAGGPKWFVSVGFDRTVIESKFLEKSSFQRVLLAGSSAGAWRCLAMACTDPLSAYEKLMYSYSRNVFTAQDNPLSVAKKIRANVESFIDDRDIPYILNHPKFDLAIHTVRSKNIAASENVRIEGMALIVSAGLNLFSSDLMKPFYEKAIFYTGPRKPDFISAGFKGAAIQMDEENLKDVALATGSLPYFIRGVSRISGAPRGVYRDGGLINYQLNEDYYPSDGLTLFFHYQEKITPSWFDKKLSWKKPSAKILDRVLQIYPSKAFLKMLPGEKIPDREDFFIFANNPDERIKRWDNVCKASETLGQIFVEDNESGRIRDLVQPL